MCANSGHICSVFRALGSESLWGKEELGVSLQARFPLRVPRAAPAHRHTNDEYTLKKNTFHVCICSFLHCEYTHVVVRGQLDGISSLPTMWVLGLKCGSSGLVTNVFTH